MSDLRSRDLWQKGRQRLGIWDVDHQPPWSLRNLTNLTRKEVLDEFNRGTRMDCVPCNRGRGNQFP
ncbi:MAG: hypothetical protein IPJ30_09950 [Acidobacteria bacterium]|nr:hypothetical protein [Acidobacteriota bacterium]